MMLLLIMIGPGDRGFCAVVIVVEAVVLELMLESESEEVEV